MKSFIVGLLFVSSLFFVQAESLVIAAGSKQDYKVISLAGINWYVGAVMQASESNTLDALNQVNRSANVLVHPDGSMRFMDINPALLQNTTPEALKAAVSAVRSGMKTLSLSDAYSSHKNYNVAITCRNSLYWLLRALDPTTFPTTQRIEIDPDPMNSLPPGWLEKIKPAKINETPSVYPNTPRKTNQQNTEGLHGDASPGVAFPDPAGVW
jgi:hypothetical protein